MFVHIGVTRFRAFTLAGLVATVILGATVAVLPTQVAGAATDVVTNCSGSASTPGSLPYEVANASLGDTVTFALSPLCTTITLGATITISDNLTITGPGSGALAIIGTGSQSDFTVGSAATATISGLTIEDGGGSAGGGIANSGTLTIVNTTVSGNSATYYGGGIDNSGTLTITNSTVSNNGVKYQQGGGIYNNGMLSVSGTTISNNNATLVGGGIDNLGTLSIANSTLSGNTSGDGGALYSDVSGHTTVTNSTIADNSASNGSDIYNNLGGTLSIGASIVAPTIPGVGRSAREGHGGAGRQGPRRRARRWACPPLRPKGPPRPFGLRRASLRASPSASKKRESTAKNKKGTFRTR